MAEAVENADWEVVEDERPRTLRRGCTAAIMKVQFIKTVFGQQRKCFLSSALNDKVKQIRPSVGKRRE